MPKTKCEFEFCSNFFFDTEKGTGLVSGNRNNAKVRLRAFFPL